jgi:hypothetical protein
VTGKELYVVWNKQEVSKFESGAQYWDNIEHSKGFCPGALGVLDISRKITNSSLLT